MEKQVASGLYVDDVSSWKPMLSNINTQLLFNRGQDRGDLARVDQVSLRRHVAMAECVLRLSRPTLPWRIVLETQTLSS